MLSVKQGGIKYHFLVFGMTRPGIEPLFPGPLANTIFIYKKQSIGFTKLNDQFLGEDPLCGG